MMEKDVMCASVLTWDLLRFIEKTVILFNSHAFVIPTYKRPIDDYQGCTHIFEDDLEPTVIVNDKNQNHAKQENDILHEFFREMIRMCLRSNSRDNKMH